jgi:membrane protein YqaA with SNARE-associated domain
MVLELAAYAGLFFSALIAATILPMQSEAILVGLLLTGEHSVAALLLTASVGNTLGGAVNWLLGRGIERFKDRRRIPDKSAQLEKAQAW